MISLFSKGTQNISLYQTILIDHQLTHKMTVGYIEVYADDNTDNKEAAGSTSNPEC